MNLYVNPFDNKEYAELNIKILNNHIDYFGQSMSLYRSIIDTTDTNYARYQQTVDKRRHYYQAEAIMGVIIFPKSNPRLTNNKGLYLEDGMKDLVSYFKSTTDVKLGDLIGIEFKVLKDILSTEEANKYNGQEVLLEVEELIDYGIKWTNTIQYKLTLARDRDIQDRIIKHTAGAGSRFGGGTRLGGS